MPTSHHSATCLRLAFFLLAISVLTTGCVRRRLTVRSNPSGARGYIDDRQIGITPFSTEFTYYGTRKIQLERDGMKTVTVERTLYPRWYQWPVIDFFTETLWPFEIRDEREIVVQMEPLAPVEPTALLGRANDLRTNAQVGPAGVGAVVPNQIPPATIPLPETIPTPPPTPAPRAGIGRPRILNPYTGPPSPALRPVSPPPQADPNLIPPGS